MTFFRNIYSWTGKPIGRTTLGRLFGASAACFLVATLFAYIAREVIEGETLRDDRRILLKLNHFATPTLDHIMIGITTVGDVMSVMAIAAVILSVLAYYRKWQAFAQLGFAIVGAAALNLTLKLIFERDRPHLWTWIIHESSYSFPSGHAMMTGALVFSLVVILWQTRYRLLMLIGGGIYLLAVGLSRLYLGVHYPTDILAGWCVSLAWVLVLATVLGAVNWRRLLK